MMNGGLAFSAPCRPGPNWRRPMIPTRKRPCGPSPIRFSPSLNKTTGLRLVNLIAPSLQRVAASFLMAGVLQVAILTADAASFFPRADRVHQEALLVDGHNDITSVML